MLAEDAARRRGKARAAVLWAATAPVLQVAAAQAAGPSQVHVSGAVTVFDRQHLAGQPYVSLDQVLTHVVSLQISSQSLHGRQLFPTVRGSGQAFGSGVVLFIDEQRIDESFFGSPFAFVRYFPVSMIDRLIVYRGTVAASIAGDAVDAVIDITTRRNASAAGSLLGQDGTVRVALQRGGHGVVTLGNRSSGLRLWAHALEDNGFRQHIQDAVGKEVSTIDPRATHSYGGSFAHNGFFVRLYGSHHSIRRGLVYGFKSHLNRARHSQLSISGGYAGTVRSTSWDVALQIAQAKGNFLGLLAPIGTRPRAIPEPLTEDYVLNEWIGQYKAALRGSGRMPLTESLALRLAVEGTAAIVGYAKQQATHNPESFEFFGALDNHGQRGSNIPAGATRIWADALATVHYVYGNLSAVGGLRFRRIWDEGFGQRPAPATGVLPLLSLRWDYAPSGHAWMAVATTLDAPPWVPQHFKNHPLWSARAFYGDLPSLKPERGYKTELGVAHELWGPRLQTAFVAFGSENRGQLRYVSEHEGIYTTAGCPPWECLPVRAFTNRKRAGRAGIEWTLSARHANVDVDAHFTQLIYTWETGFEDPPTFSNSSGGLRGVSRLGNHRIGMAISAFDAFSNTLVGKRPYVILDVSWGYRLADWGLVRLTLSNLTGSTPGGLRRTMPNGYPSRDTTGILQLEVLDAATAATALLLEPIAGDAVTVDQP